MRRLSVILTFCIIVRNKKIYVITADCFGSLLAMTVNLYEELHE